MNRIYNSLCNSSDDESFKLYFFNHIGNDNMGRKRKSEIFYEKIQLARYSGYFFKGVKNDIGNYMKLLDSLIFGIEMYRFDDRYEWDIEIYKSKDDIINLDEKMKKSVIDKMHHELHLVGE